MSECPWPKSTTDPILFIIDASHEVERQILDNWLKETRESSDYSGEFTCQYVPIAREPENIPSEVLMGVSDLPPRTIVTPIRVVWRNSLNRKNTTPRLKDLLGGNPRRPSVRLAKKILSHNPARIACVAAEPATVAQLSDRFRNRNDKPDDKVAFADFVAGQAGLALDTAERRLQGGRYKVPRRVAINMLASEKFRLALADVSEQTGRSVESLEDEAHGIFKELIAVPKTFWQDIMASFNRKLISMGYESDFVVDKDSIERFKKIVREHPSAILWTHKTHIDGFAVYSMLFENDFPTPHVLGGVNMAFAGLGYAAKRAGAIFIRRSFQNDPLYKMILRQYIGYLLEKRFPLTWAFEGTRSRVGKLMPPKYGLIKYVIEAAHATDTRNLHIIPVAINYDLIGDVGDYVAEQSGARKRPESLRWFMSYIRGLRQPLGRIYIDFGEPVVLEKAPSGDDTLALKKIAFQVGVQVNKVSPITLSSIMTMILLGAAPRALTRDELVNEIVLHLNWARQRNIRTTGEFDRENDEKTAQLVNVLVTNGLITRYDEGPETVYAIAPEQHTVAGYYRNTTIHHFVTKAIIELALLHTANHVETGEVSWVEVFWRESERLRDIFKFEFFYAPTEQFREEVVEELARFNPQWQDELRNHQGAAATLLNSFKPFVAHATLLSFIEAYRIVATVLAGLSSDQTLSEAECVSKSLSYGRQAYLQRRISSESSIGKVLFQNGYKLASSMNLTQAGELDVGARRIQMSHDFRSLARRLDRIRAMALPDSF